MYLTVFMYVFCFETWSLCFNLDICPLIWNFGIGLERPDEDSFVAASTLTISVPTLRLEIAWGNNEDIDRIERFFEAAEKCQAESKL